MVSVASRRPAVSISLKLIPWMLSTSSIVSRVVPGIWLTIARSSFKRVFSKVDLPAFGRPAITVLTPFLITLPNSNDCIRWPITLVISCINCFNWSRLANSTSSSEKSSSSSTNEAKVTNCSRKVWSWLLNPPLNCCIATCCEAFELDAIKSATASACDRSSCPFRNALKVNSPGFAERAPFLISSLIMDSII